MEPASSPRATFLLPRLNRQVSFLVDTGSPVSLLPWTTTRQKLSELKHYCGRVLSVCGQSLEVLGQCDLEIKFGNNVFVQDFLVTRGVSVPILGIDFLRRYSVVIDVANRCLSLEWGRIPFDCSGPPAAQFHVDALEFEEALTQTLSNFSDIIRLDENCVGDTRLIEHDIVLQDDTPVFARPRPIPFHLREVVHEQISRMLELGVIQKSVSSWSSPILLVPKPDGKYRFCVDFRRLNAQSERDISPVPRIDLIFPMVGSARIFSTVDLLSGFWQVSLTKRARAYTAFSVGNQQYEFVKMPFGLSGAPSTFIRLMNMVLEGLENVVVYGDDVLVYSASTSDHTKHLTAVLDKLRRAGLVINAKKCQFGRKEVNFLGHKLSAGKVSPLPEKTVKYSTFYSTRVKETIAVISWVG